MTRRVVVSAWLGFALAALFFYPLADALRGDIYYLQWQFTDVVETGTALILLAPALACVVFVAWRRPTRRATAALVVASAIPLASLAAGVSRELPFEDVLRGAWENRALRLALPAAVAGFIAFAFVLRPESFGRWFRRLLILVSPVSLVVVASIATSVRNGAPIVTVERASGAGEAGGRTCAPLLALLFDELSFSYLYNEAGNVRPEFPEIGRLGAAATHYGAVAAPGGETLNALPSFLAARPVRDIEIHGADLMELTDDGRLVRFSAAGPDGLFATARRLGFRTEMAGYYLAYCDVLAEVVDACQSLSLYNAASGRERFSPVDPVLTTLVLWPRQFPFGLLKNPPFAAHQRDMVARTAAFAGRPVRGERPVFRFVHFSVPHMPFVFDGEGYNPPFDPLQTVPDAAYRRQLRYVDRLVGDLLGTLRRNGTFDGTTIVILADHGYRFGEGERDPLHIPFIVKAPGQQDRVVVDASLRGESLLKQVLEGSCRTPP